jgi:hydroxymethylbilane synthase
VAAPDRIILGSRGSELAQAQARMVEQALRKAHPAIAIEIRLIQTSGDERSPRAPIIDRKAGRKGMFTREIEKELAAGTIDLAVHSAKDLPSEQPNDLEVRATLPRANTEDILVTRDNFRLTNLPSGATIATGSIRRQRQLRWQRPDLQIVGLRGNVPTRLRKLRENENWSGIILARAGLERLGLDFNGEVLSEENFVSAGGQGIIALQVRRSESGLRALLEAIDDLPTHLCLRAEREFLRLLDGDCDSPVGVQARIAGELLQIRAQVFGEEEEPPRMATVSGPSTEPEKIAGELMKKIYGN